MSYIFYSKKDTENLDFHYMRAEYTKNALRSLADGTMRGADALGGWALIDKLESYAIGYDAAIAGHAGDSTERNPSYEWLASNLFFHMDYGVGVVKKSCETRIETFEEWSRRVLKKYSVPDSMSIDDVIDLCNGALHKAYDAGLPDAQRRLKEEKEWRLRVKQLNDDLNDQKTEEA